LKILLLATNDAVWLSEIDPVVAVCFVLDVPTPTDRHGRRV